jgi:hypothetical protein
MAFLRNLLLSGLSICLVMIGSVPLANADCLSRCLPMCDYNQPYCRDLRNNCSTQCAGKGSHDYGAIAYSRQTGATGWSKNRDTREEAETDALENCDATNCEVEVWLDDTCAAVSAAENGRPVWALGATARQAQVNALEKCSVEGGRKCEVKESVCSRGRAD